MFKRIKNLWKLSNLELLEDNQLFPLNKNTAVLMKPRKATIIEPDPIEELGVVIENENV